MKTTLPTSNKKRIIIIIVCCLVFVILAFVLWFRAANISYKSARAKCPDYGYPYEKEPFAFGPGVSDQSEFIDCGGNIVIEKRRDIYAPNPKYPYVVENYRLDTMGTWPKVIVSSDKARRFKFKDQLLYIFSSSDGAPKYYILDTETGNIKNVYTDIKELPQDEQIIFTELAK